MSKKVTINFEGKTFELPVIEGTEGEKAIDISSLRQKTGLVCLDPGFMNTASCKSRITFVDGERGILRYRGIPVEKLAEHSTFKETAFLLINGRLPSKKETMRFSEMLTEHSLIHEDMKIFYQSFPKSSHPMGILSSMVNALRSFYPELENHEEEINITVTRLLSKVRTMAAMSYNISRGRKVVYPRRDLSYCANFLHMMFDSPVKRFEIDKAAVDALRVFWILHADHEQNCSTSAVRLVGSARVNLYAAISAGISALWGPLHGGASQAVVEMLENIRKRKLDPKQFIENIKSKKNKFRLMGFGHRVYKTYDPRAKILRKRCDILLKAKNQNDPLLEIARSLEEAALKDGYFIERNLYPNVDFYSGIVLRAIGIPTNMFTVLFAIGRLAGWIAQWKESMMDPNWKLCRPRQIYVGNNNSDYLQMDKRFEN